MRYIASFIFLCVTLFSPLLKAETIFEFDNTVAINMVRVEISAPIETTRAQEDAVQGKLIVDLENPAKTHGQVKVDLFDLTSFSFSDPKKNAAQTEHMKNWFEVGPDVSTTLREKNRWAIFDIKKIIHVEPASLQSSPAFHDKIGMGHAFKLTAEGDFTLHNITKSKTVDLDVILYDVKKGGPLYQGAKRILMMRTRSPLHVSLKAHEVQPRDATGKFLAGALSTVGLKISDDAQVSLDLRAYEPKSGR